MCALLLPYGPWMANRVATLQHDRTKKSRFCYVAELDSWHFFQGKEPLLGGLTPQQFSPINVNLKGDTFGPNFDLLPNKMISGFQIHFCYVPFCWTKDPIFCWFSSPTILEVFCFPLWALVARDVCEIQYVILFRLPVLHPLMFHAKVPHCWLKPAKYNCKGQKGFVVYLYPLSNEWHDSFLHT